MSSKSADPKKPTAGQASGERPGSIMLETALCKQVMLSADSDGAAYSLIQFAIPSGSPPPSREWQRIVSEGEDASLAEHFDVFLSDDEVEKQDSDRGLDPATTQEHQADHDNAADMSTQDRYIDARLAGIEGKLDARMEAMLRLQEKSEERFKEAESRFEKASERHSAEVSLLSQKFDSRFDETRRHTTMVGFGVFAVVAIIAGLSWYWISEQGSYAKSYGETQVEIQQAQDERAATRETLKSIQATQQSIQETQAAILDRLPPRQPEAEAQPEAPQPNG